MQIGTSYSVLTDKKTSIALQSIGKRIHDLQTFPVNLNRFIPLKIGKTKYELFNNGMNPFYMGRVMDDCLLLFPEDFKETFNIIFGGKPKNNQTVNEYLSYVPAQITTIPISEKVPRFFLGRKNTGGKDIRIVVPTFVQNIYNHLDVFDLSKLEKTPPIVIMNKVVLSVIERTGFCTIKKVGRITHLDFEGYKWFELILFGGYRIDPELIDLPKNTTIFCFDLPLDQKEVQESRILGEIYENQYQEFVLLKDRISFLKLGRSFIKKGESSFQHIVNEVLNFKLVCVSVFIPTSTKLIIFEVMQNLVNFKSKNPVISKPIDKKCQKENIKEIEENAMKLLEEEDRERMERTELDKIKLEKELERMRIHEENQKIEKIKAISYTIAKEAKELVIKKKLNIKNAEIKAANKFMEDLMFEVVEEFVGEIVCEWEIEVLDEDSYELGIPSPNCSSPILNMFAQLFDKNSRIGYYYNIYKFNINFMLNFFVFLLFCFFVVLLFFS